MSRDEQIDFNVDKNNLYREESFTDLKVAAIRRLVPVKVDGSEDRSRTPVFVGHTQILTPHGPLPLQAMLPANNIADALDVFPQTMEQEMVSMMQQLRQMQEEEKRKEDSRIIVPGR